MSLPDTEAAPDRGQWQGGAVMSGDRRDAARAFGQTLRAARLERGISQEQLAEAGDFDRTYRSLLERGLRTPTFFVIVRLAEGLASILWRCSGMPWRDCPGWCPRERLGERDTIAAVAELLAALQLSAQVVSRELGAIQPISFAAASNRRVIGSMNEYVWQLGSYLTRTGDPLELSLQLSKTPMSAIGSKSNYGFPDDVARALLMSWEH